MKGLQLRKWHGYAGIVIAPFAVVQTLSGLLLNFGALGRSGAAPSPSVPPQNLTETFLFRVHFGPGLIGDIYHILLGAGIIWMAVTGTFIFITARRRQRQEKRAS